MVERGGGVAPGLMRMSGLIQLVFFMENTWMDPSCPPAATMSPDGLYEADVTGMVRFRWFRTLITWGESDTTRAAARG